MLHCLASPEAPSPSGCPCTVDPGHTVVAHCSAHSPSPRILPLPLGAALLPGRPTGVWGLAIRSALHGGDYRMARRAAGVSQKTPRAHVAEVRSRPVAEGHRHAGPHRIRPVRIRPGQAAHHRGRLHPTSSPTELIAAPGRGNRTTQGRLQARQPTWVSAAEAERLATAPRSASFAR